MAQDDKPTLVQRPAGYDKLVPKGYKNVAKDKVYKKLEDITKTDVATFIAEMTPVIGDAIAAKEVYDEIQKDDPNWLLIGALGGATIIGAVPFVGDAASKLIKKGARQALDVAKRIEVDPNALGSLGGNIRIKAAQEVVEDFVPQKTVKAYKLFTKGKDGKLYPLFVDAQKEVPTDKWLAATFPDYRFTAENGKQYVPSKGTDGKPGTGDSINIPDQETRDKLIEAGFLPKGSKAKAVKAVAARPGWHAGDVPIATHIGPETNIGGKQVKYRGDDQVWAEIEMPADVDWQQIANSKARIKKDGNIDVRTADINDEMPKAGHYRYKTNPNMTGEWLISGDMKVNRVLDRSEVNAINEAAGVKDLPTLSELNKGYSKGGTVMDDYQYAEMMGNGYAVGGVVEKQTRMAFADGGLPVDPVSGNEVPPGSLPEEVRDDIKVGVSAGEYIVPADVLRYYGMKFFEDLRAEAKVALGGMEQDGRMGGEPMGGEPMMEAPMEEEDDLPFSTEELQSTDDVEMNKGGYMRGYAEAGLVTDPAAVAAENPDTQIQMDSMFGNMGSVNTGIEYLIYYGPNGEEITIQTFNGQPMSPIPPGYTIAPTAVAPITPVVTAPATGNAVAKAKAPVAAKAITKDKNDNDKPDPVKPETEAERMSRYQKRYGVDFTADEETQKIQIQDSLNAQKVKLGLLEEVVGTDGQGNKVTNLVDSITGKVFKKGTIANKTTSKLLNNVLGTLVGSFIPAGLGLVVGGVKKIADKVQASATSIELLETQLKMGVINEDTFKKEVTAIRSKFNNKDEIEAGIAPDASLGDWIAGLVGWGNNKNQRGDFAEAQSFYSTNANGTPTLTKKPSTAAEPPAKDNQALVDRIQNTTPEQDAYKVATQNIVNRTGKQVIIGSVTPGGQVSEPGFTWVKNPGTNAITRIWTGTKAAGNPADAGAGVRSGGNQGGDNSRQENRDFGNTGVNSSKNKASADKGKQTGKGSGPTSSGKGGTGRGRSDKGMAKGGLMTKKK